MASEIASKSPFGLSGRTTEQIHSVFRLFPQLKEAIIYGSRAMGNHRNGSDIDLTLAGNSLTLNTLNRIAIALDDLLLPYTFDLSIYDHIQDSHLLEHIARVGKVFYRSA